MSAPSASRHHADWLSLVEVSGPFVSLPVLLRVFPQGLEPRDPAQAKALRAAYDEWQDNHTAPGTMRAWVLHVLTAVLGYPLDQIAEGQALPAGLEANMREMGETLRPDFALVGPAGSDAAGQAQLLVASYPAEQALDRPVIGKHWKATPATRMMELLHGARVPLGVVTNGEHWMLVYAPPRETTGYASWYGALWLDEPITLRSFHSLLGVRRFFGVAADSTLLALLRESAADQQEVTDQLGYQVREAVEVLVQSFDALDKESNRTLLTGVSPSVLYDAALTVMMRLVFLFSAEERGLLHLGKPLYDDNYAVSTLQEQLQEVADRFGEEVLERRYDAWGRLLAAFRAVHGGIQHQDLLMQAYGGSLFNPDRYPFLEGRPADSDWRSASAEPLAVNNRVVLHLLNSLQRLRTKIGVGGMAETRRISFRALGVEQIGHVYEGLLDHSAIRASEPVLGIKGTRSKEPEIALTKIESLLARGRDKLIEVLKEETGRSVSALSRALEEGSLVDEDKLLIACGHDKALLDRLRPFTGLIREDSFERPLVVLLDSVYVTAGSARRSTGTHYTPPSLTEPVVQHTLEPLIYEGPAEGLPREQWKLKPPKAILDLKICDMAMGSGAFLVQACRYLAERLTEAWENEEKQHPGEVLITPEGKFSQGTPSERLVPADTNERIAIARRVVADRCLYGVDINPMAVEMAKLSLWLITVDRDRPFTFLDHAFKCGDSLLGITSLEQLENFSLRPGGVKQQAFATLDLRRHVDEARKKRDALEAMPSDTPEQITAKAALHAEAEAAVAKLNTAADGLMTMELNGLKGRAYDKEREASADFMVAHWAKGVEELHYRGHQGTADRGCFHWGLAYPEIIGRGGFDAFMGNPPFLGGKRISTELDGGYGPAIKRIVTPGEIGAADLCAYFFRRCAALIRNPGYFGLIATNTLSQGDTRLTALKSLNDQGLKTYRAFTDYRWPGIAGVVVHIVFVTKGKSMQQVMLNDVHVESIDSYLEAAPISGRKDPFHLKTPPFVVSTGTYLYGEGFVLSKTEMDDLVSRCPDCQRVIQPYITSDDLNTRFDLSAGRYAINFGDFDEPTARKYSTAFNRLEERVKPVRSILTGQIHEHCFWKHWDKRPELYSMANSLSRFIVCGRLSKYFLFAFAPTEYLFSDQLVVFGSDKASLLSILQSELHVSWAVWRMTTMGKTPRYSISRCFHTFPLPANLDSQELRNKGEEYSSYRSDVLNTRTIGLTKLYNHFHDQGEGSDDIARLRIIHAGMDQAVAAAYGWQDLDLRHGFHETKQGMRYTISEAARRLVLDRLLALNHRRHAEEEAQRAALAASGPPKRGRKNRDSSGQVAMDV